MGFLTLIKKFHLENIKYITSNKIKEYCNMLNLDYGNIIRYLLRHGYVIRIFKGIFYVKSLEEFKYGGLEVSELDLVSKGLDLKRVEKWYFGLYTALKLNNATHEYFTIYYVITDSLYRNNPFFINKRRFRFLKIKPSLFDFGIIKNGVR